MDPSHVAAAVSCDNPVALAAHGFDQCLMHRFRC
jgi:hypothetical protein